MAENKSIIRSEFEPTIILDEISFDDSDEGTGIARERGTKLQKHIGNNFPLIKINDYLLSENEIEYFVIDTTGFLPEIHLIVNIMSPATFLSRAMPKDGDRINVFIRARNDIFKPIRNDYLITAVDSSKSAAPSGEGITLSISGELFVPGLYDEATRSHKGTSIEVLRQIAKELNLGFATNEEYTSDAQNWICANDTYLNYIKHITGSAWKDENSFFTAFIDIYYHLNFINVNNQFSNTKEINYALVDALFSDDSLDGSKIEAGVEKKIFTNLPNKKGTPMFIQRFKLVNESSEIAAKFGYKMHCQFFEHNSLESWDIFSEPLIEPGTEKNQILLKGKPGENYYKTQIKKKWAGIQYSLPEHNVHEKYLYAKVHNLLNNKELEKLQVHIEVPRANFNIYRGERVPCIFFSIAEPMRTPYLQNDADREAAAYDETFGQAGAPALDRFYSGFYLVYGMRFIYSTRNPTNPSERGFFAEEIVLTRRTWPVPV